jgi:hypothetical protein
VRTAGPDDVRATIAGVQEGRAAQADIAAVAGVPYGVVLLHRDAGLLPAADLAPPVREAGEAAAVAALDRGGCVADLSAVHTLQLLPARAAAAARTRLPGMVVSRDAVRDAVRGSCGMLGRLMGGIHALCTGAVTVWRGASGGTAACRAAGSCGACRRSGRGARLVLTDP